MLEETRDAIRCMVWEQADACHLEGVARYEENGKLPDRRFSVRHEIAYRLCHHDFFGLGTDDAAEVLRVHPNTVRYMLNRVKEVAPQLFPILPRRSARIYFLFTVENLASAEIAGMLDISTHTVTKSLYRMYKNREQTGLYFRSGSIRRISYSPWMDNVVKREF